MMLDQLLVLTPNAWSAKYQQIAMMQQGHSAVLKILAFHVRMIDLTAITFLASLFVSMAAVWHAAQMQIVLTSRRQLTQPIASVKMTTRVVSTSFY